MMIHWKKQNLTVFLFILWIFAVLLFMRFYDSGQFGPDERNGLFIESDLDHEGSEEEITRKNAEEECIRMMKTLQVIYRNATEKEPNMAMLSDAALQQMINAIKEKDYPVRSVHLLSDMAHYDNMHSFLKKASSRLTGDIVVYEVTLDGGLRRKHFSFDGTDMYELCTTAGWDEDREPFIRLTSYTKIKEWEYTQKGWFCYQLCVPEYPEVSEVIDGSSLMRVIPMTDENRQMTEIYLKELGYQGTNLLFTNWDEKHMEEIDFNGLYEYLYALDTGQSIKEENCVNGIPKEQFESLIMKYLPVSEKELKEYASYDRKMQTYPWTTLGCMNHTLSFFGTSVPEVIKKTENKDGTITLTVDAVCEMMLCDDSVIRHEVTIRIRENGSFQYTGNRIIEEREDDIPEYQYRIK